MMRSILSTKGMDTRRGLMTVFLAFVAFAGTGCAGGPSSDRRPPPSNDEPSSASVSETPASARTRAEIERLGGKIELDESHPDRPVIGVSFGWNKQVRDEDLAHLKDLPALRALSLEATNITDAGMEHVKNLRDTNKLFTSPRPIRNWHALTAMIEARKERDVPAVREAVPEKRRGRKKIDYTKDTGADIGKLEAHWAATEGMRFFRNNVQAFVQAVLSDGALSSKAANTIWRSATASCLSSDTGWSPRNGMRQPSPFRRESGCASRPAMTGQRSNCS